MRRASTISLLVALMLVTSATALVATSGPADGGAERMTSSHIGGSLLLCGQVIDYTAPDGIATDGAMTMVGVSQPDPHAFTIAATAAISAGDDALLTAIAAADSFTCLTAVGDGMGVLVELAIAPTAEFCGSVAPSGTTWMLTGIDFPDLTTTLTGEAETIVDNDPRLDDLLLWFDTFGNEACLTFATDASGVVVEIALDGELTICGPVAEVADTSSALYFAVLEFDVVTGVPVRPDIVGLGGIILPASLFTDAALGVLELAYAVQQHPEIDGSASICALVPVVDTELLPASFAETSVSLCGQPTSVDDTIGLTEPTPPDVLEWYALLSEGVLGYPSAVLFPSAPNLTMTSFVADVMCVDATLDGGGSDETLTVLGSTDVCVEVVAVSATAVTLRPIGGEVAFGFELTPGSDVDPALDPGTHSAVRIVAGNGVDGAVTITETTAPCDGGDGGGGGALPDTALGAPSGDARGAQP